MDQLAAMKVFVAVADAGSLSAAGRRLSMPLTTVSRHLAALEELVGVRLITRTTRELALTETGRHYLGVMPPHPRRARRGRLARHRRSRPAAG